jgi:hypothetical protein
MAFEVNGRKTEDSALVQIGHSNRWDWPELESSNDED